MPDLHDPYQRVPRIRPTLALHLAPQNVTDTPFRVVDEINQGMDEFNERKVSR